MKITWRAGEGPYVTEIDDNELAECDEWNREEFVQERIGRDFLLFVPWIEIKRE